MTWQDAHVLELQEAPEQLGAVHVAERRGRVPPRLRVPVVQGTIRFADALLLFAALVYTWFSLPHPGWHEDRRFVLASLLASMVTLVLLHRGGFHLVSALQRPARQARILATALVAGLAVLLACILFLRPDMPSPARAALAWLVPSLVLMSGFHGVLCPIVRSYAASGRLRRNVAVVGTRPLAQGFARRVAGRPDIHVSGVFHELSGIGLESAQDVLNHCRAHRVDAIVIAVPLFESQLIAELRRQLGQTIADIYLAGLENIEPRRSRLAKFADQPMLVIHERPMSEWDSFQKRVFDLVTGSLLLVMLLLPLALIALIIRLDSPGPVLFRQPRLGFDNTMFNIFKFRTMHHHMSDKHADQQTMRGDPRITRCGRWIRRFGIDELPQLFNVLIGDMSLVGPRPHAINTKAGEHKFTDVVATYALRHRVKPGITGWAQVNGWRGETRTVEHIENRVAHDLYYIENWSIWLDARIILLTALREVVSRHAF